MKEKEVMEEVKEIMRRAKNKKDSEVAVDQNSCELCRIKFKTNNISLKCIRCESWIHLKCTQFRMGAVTDRNKNTFLCKSCSTLEDYFNEDNESKTGDEDENRVDNENINNNKKEIALVNS